MKTRDLIELLHEADPEGTADVWLFDGDYGLCQPKRAVFKGSEGVVLYPDPEIEG